MKSFYPAHGSCLWVCNLFSLRCTLWYVVMIFMNIKSRINILLLIGAVVTSLGVTANPVQAETGEGKDIFKVILTIFGIDKSKGDVVAMVTVNDGEASKVKFLDTDAFLAPSNLTALSPSTTDPAAGSDILEYVATFPNVTVDTGEEYKACVLPVKDLEMICTTGNNSPASRPEFVDLSLNATSDIEQLSTEDGDSGDEDNEEDGDLSPGIPPTG
jgi:hypothetical protein